MIVEACVAVVRDGGRLLLHRRPRGGHLAGTWEFPGGKRRPGERGRTCAEREAREETGLRVRAGEEIARVRHDYPDRRVDLRFFACVVVGGRLRRSAALRWVTPAGLRRLPIPEANRVLLPRLTGSPSPRRRPPRGASASARRGPGTRPASPTAR